MTDDIKRRLERLQDDLAGLWEAGFGSFGFGIVTASTPVRLPYPNGWKWLEFWLEGLLGADVPASPRCCLPYDSLPDGSACVRWWGEVRGDRRVSEMGWASLGPASWNFGLAIRQQRKPGSVVRCVGQNDHHFR